MKYCREEAIYVDASVVPGALTWFRVYYHRAIFFFASFDKGFSLQSLPRRMFFSAAVLSHLLSLSGGWALRGPLPFPNDSEQ